VRAAPAVLVSASGQPRPVGASLSPRAALVALSLRSRSCGGHSSTSAHPLCSASALPFFFLPHAVVRAALTAPSSSRVRCAAVVQLASAVAARGVRAPPAVPDRVASFTVFAYPRRCGGGRTALCRGCQTSRAGLGRARVHPLLYLCDRRRLEAWPGPPPACAVVSAPCSGHRHVARVHVASTPRAAPESAVTAAVLGVGAWCSLTSPFAPAPY
jgi:hypothetical protein